MPSQLPAPLVAGLTAKQIAFAEHYVDLGGKHQGRAAVMAGFSPSGADAIASRLLRRPDVLRLLRHYVETRLEADLVASSETLRQLRDDPTVPPGERRKCASELLDRGGMILTKLSEHHVVVENSRESRAQVIREIVDFARSIDVDPRKLVGSTSDVTDADFRIVDAITEGREPPDEPDEPSDDDHELAGHNGTQGIEDLLSPR